MAIDYYAPGDLASGFAGWRVGGTIRGKRYQKYFSVRNPYALVEDNVWLEYQARRARYYEAKMLARSAACQYIDFISTNHPRTLPCRGLGFRGMTIAILKMPGTEQFRCQFVVNNRNRTKRFAITATQDFNTAWHAAVTAWGETYDVREKDIDFIRTQHLPKPEAFKQLRRQMNENEGYRIPVDALHFAFKGQRDQIQIERKSPGARVRQNVAISANDDMADRLAQEIRNFSKLKRRESGA